jgi:replicative DNA helicase
MSTAGIKFCSSLIASGDSESIFRNGLTEEDFVTNNAEPFDERRLFQFIRRYVTTYGHAPDIIECAAEFPLARLEAVRVTQNTDYWAQKIIQRRLLYHADGLKQRLTDLVLEGNVEGIRTAIGRFYRELQDSEMGGIRIIDAADAIDSVLRSHDSIQQTGCPPGIPFGLRYIDMVTGGIRSGDSYVIIGPSNTGKTQTLLNAAGNAYLLGHKVALASFEMTAEQLGIRLAAQFSKVSSRPLRMGRMSFFGRRQIDRRLAEIVASGIDKHNFKIIEGGFDMSVLDLIAICRDFKPSILFVDGAYLMRSGFKTSAMWENVSYTAQRLRGLAISGRIAVVSSYQMDQSGKTTGVQSIRYSKAAGELGTLGIEIELVDKFAHTVVLKYNIFKGREGESGWVIYQIDTVTHTMQEQRCDLSIGVDNSVFD